MRLQQHQVHFGRSVIAYRIERSDRRNTVTISVDPRAGVLLKVPSDAPIPRLDGLVKTKAPWILQRLLEFREFGPGPAPREFAAGESFSYLGRNYRLKIERSAGTAYPFAFLHGGFLTVTLGQRTFGGEAEVLIKRAVVDWYRRQAERRLAERVAVYARRAGLRPPPLLVREQEKRWGSCNSKGHLRLNWRVMMAPMRLVDYVVAHEVCHLLVRDHSRRFWKLLATILPDYEILRDRLRVDGVRFNV